MSTKDNNMDIEIREPVATGTYANLSIINHSSNEFVFDFISIMPGVPKAQVVSRIILTPQNAKRLYMALYDNIERYEARLGEIKEEPEVQMPIDFKNPGEA